MGDHENALGPRALMENRVCLPTAPADVHYERLVRNNYSTAELWSQLGDEFGSLQASDVDRIRERAHSVVPLVGQLG